MDVYLEEMVNVPFETEDSREMIKQSGEANTVFDLETEQMTKKKYRLILPKRVRFYHAKIDATSLKSGDSYGKLKNVIVVMIMPFDPFDRNRMVYTIANGCKEEPDMEYDDGARTFKYAIGILAARCALQRSFHLRTSAIHRRLNFQQGTSQLKVVLIYRWNKRKSSGRVKAADAVYEVQYRNQCSE